MGVTLLYLKRSMARMVAGYPVQDLLLGSLGGGSPWNNVREFILKTFVKNIN